MHEIPQESLGRMERLVEMLPSLERAQYLLIVIVVPFTFRGDHDLQRRAFAVLGELGERREEHVHRIVFEHLVGLQGIRRMLVQGRIGADMSAGIIEEVVIAAQLRDAGIGKNRRDKTLCEPHTTARRSRGSARVSADPVYQDRSRRGLAAGSRRGRGAGRGRLFPVSASPSAVSLRQYSARGYDGGRPRGEDS